MVAFCSEFVATDASFNLKDFRTYVGIAFVTFPVFALRDFATSLLLFRFLGRPLRFTIFHLRSCDINY